MNSFFTIILVGISLSMDAFSLALIYGTQGINRKDEIVLSMMVGLFHFFMPLIGFFVGNYLFSYFKINLDYLIGIIFFIIGLEMIISSLKGKKVSFLDNIWSYMLFSFSVSIDSFTTGLGFRAISNNYFMVSFMFMLCSFFFTYIGLLLGNIFNTKFGSISTIMGGVILVFLAIYYLL